MALIDPLTPEAEAFLREWNDGRDYVEAHTSGSTGTPKTVRLLKSDMRLSARATNAHFGIVASSVLALPLSVAYIAGKMMAVRALEADCRLLLLPQHRVLDLDDAAHMSLLAVVPAQVPSLIRNPRWASKIENVLIGGAPLEADAEQELTHCGYCAWASYGMTETCSHVALRPLGTDVYTAMPGVTFDTDDGTLAVNGPYSWRRLVTNDLAELVSPTQMRWLGRADNAINSGGVKLLPERLEVLLGPYMRHPFYITGREDHVWGQAVTLCIESADVVDVDAVMAECRRVLPRYGVPRSVEVVPAFERTSSGKIIRR